MKHVIFLKFTVILLAIILCNCGDEGKDHEDYNTSSNDIVLIDPEKHAGGYGRKECLVCHNAALNLHRSPNSVINVDQLNEAIRNNGESKFCLSCHGANGTGTQ